MMLSKRPDESLCSIDLERSIRSIISQLKQSEQWQYREEYIDRSILDPYYLLMIRWPETDLQDNTWNQELFQTAKPGVSFVNRTALSGKTYWQNAAIQDVANKLLQFKEHFDHNRFQPPGLTGDLHHPKQAHEVFSKRRFIYEIRSPFETLTGIGPSMFALSAGAVCGTVYDQNGQPLDDVVISLSQGDQKLTRTTKDGGLFWFSKVSAGQYTLKVEGKSCIVRLLRRDEFGHIKGWLTDANGYPIDLKEFRFKAPDGEVFSAISKDSGRFTTGPLPAYPIANSPLSNYTYIMDIPDFLFSIRKSTYVKDAVIGGILKSKEGKIIQNGTVVLLQRGVEISRSKSDLKGNFRFFGLPGGHYELEVPGSPVYLSQISPGRISGKALNHSVSETWIELIAKDELVASARLNKNNAFSFDNLAPGEYDVIIKNK